MDTETLPTEFRTGAHLIFGQAGNAAQCQVSGFSWAEDGYTWAVGPAAVLRVKLHPGQGDLMLEISLRPYMVPPFLMRQRIGVVVEGQEIGQEWAQDDTVLGFRLPRLLVADRDEIEIAIALPDAVSPTDLRVANDDRRLGCQMREILLVWVPQEPPVPPRRAGPLPFAAGDPPERIGELARFCTGLTLRDLMLHFESLGHNCELGLVQKACDADPQGLLRFVGISVHRLLEGLDFGFEGVDDPALIRAYPASDANPEWLVRHDRYGMHAHSFQKVSQIGEAAFVDKQVTMLRLQRRRLLDVLQTGENLFVFQRQEKMTVAHALPLLTMLRSYGPNALLFVNQGGEEPSGSVDQLGAHLFRGNIDKLAPVHDVGVYQLTPWISICANAYRLWRESGHGV